MGKKIDFVALGELLIDFTESGKSTDGQRLFEQNPGGAPANFLTVASHMGYATSFIGKVGKDMHGIYLKEVLEQEGIRTDNLICDDNYFTTLAFVAINEKGERAFSFARKPGADTQLTSNEIDRKLLNNCRIFHLGSLSLTCEPSRTASFDAVKEAKKAGALISYDPNYRASLWESKEDAVEKILSMIPYVDFIKVSDEESYLITGEKEVHKAAEKILQTGPRMVAVTLGEHGVLLANKENSEIVPAFKVMAIDTTGAGDSFWGGFLSRFLECHKEPEQMEWNDWRNCALFGNAVAAICVQKRGGIPAIPSRDEVNEFMLSGNEEN